jgi:ankyrin repeat protein
MLACIYYNNNETKINEKFDCIRLLVDSGAKLNVRNKESGFTCMHWVARYGEIENVRFLCERGMAIYVPDMHGYIPLDYAGLFDCKEVMIYLIK